MSEHVNASDFAPIYSELGINLDTLGCVLLDLEKVHVTSFIPETEGKVENELYRTKNPERHWIDGAVAERKAHVTLLYGLLSEDWQDYIQLVLRDWDAPLFVEIDGLEVFDSPYADENYACIVARVKITPELQEGHARLELLPHVNTFLEWRAHVTLAFVRSEYRDKWVSALKSNLPTFLPVTGIDIGEISHD